MFSVFDGVISVRKFGRSKNFRFFFKKPETLFPAAVSKIRSKINIFILLLYNFLI